MVGAAAISLEISLFPYFLLQFTLIGRVKWSANELSFAGDVCRCPEVENKFFEAIGCQSISIHFVFFLLFIAEGGQWTLAVIDD